MNINAFLWTTLALTASAQASDTVRVCMNPETTASLQVLVIAESAATRILADAGVHLEWHSSAPAVCRAPTPIRTVVVDFTTDLPASAHAGALAYSQPFEGMHIVVLFDRIRIAGSPEQEGALLGHVIAHELGHILQGLKHHSPVGVMKANWNSRDIVQMRYAPLRFAPEDIDLIKRGIHGSATAQVELRQPSE